MSRPVDAASSSKVCPVVAARPRSRKDEVETAGRRTCSGLCIVSLQNTAHPRAGRCAAAAGPIACPQECESEPRDQLARVLALATALAVGLFSLTDGSANTAIGEAARYSDTNRPRWLPTISPVADLSSTEKLFPWQVKVPLATLSRRSVVSSSRGSASCFRVG